VNGYSFNRLTETRHFFVNTRPDSNQHLHTSADETRATADVFVAAFRERWRSGQQPIIEQHLPPGDQPHFREVLIALIEIDLEHRLARGDSVRLEEYLSRFPQIAPGGQIPLDLIASEFESRRRIGQRVSMDEFAERFPSQVDDLRRQLDAGSMDEGRPTGEVKHEPLPTGTHLGDFEIVGLLGSGSLAHVYLARQQSLDRLVALKVAHRVSDEGRTQARLEHDHVVPVFSEHEQHGLRLLAMRYVQGCTAAELLEHFQTTQRLPRKGRELLAALDYLTAKHRFTDPGEDREDTAATTLSNPDAPDHKSEQRQSLESDSCPRAVSRLMLGLARALVHAHQRGVLHRDIKPANILIARDGRAMLMDFNVSVRTNADDAALGHLGGTLPYMAPEHLALLAPQADQEPAPIDERSDIYSLGIVFYELLTGTSPFAQQNDPRSLTASVHRMLAERLQGPRPMPLTAATPPGLQSIVSRCLAPRPEDRYESAAALAEDLERFLTHRPLRYANDPSISERASKWIRRHPRLISAGAVLLMCLAIFVGAAGLAESRRLSAANQLIHDAEQLVRQQQPTEAARLVAQAEGLLSVGQYVLPLLGARPQHQIAQQQLADLSARIADEQFRLFQLRVDELRAQSLSDSPSGESTDDLLASYGVLEHDSWRDQPTYQQLSEAQRNDVDESVAELLLVRAIDLLEDSQPGEQPLAKARAAYDLLRRVPPEHRRRVAVRAVSSQLASRLGASESAWDSLPIADDPPRGARARAPADPSQNRNLSEFDHYLLGVAAAKRGDHTAAVEHLEASLAARPAGERPRYWAQFQLAVSLEQCGRHEEAIATYETCIRMRPKAPWPHHNMGLIYAAKAQYEQAANCFHEALEHAPNLTPALANLGVVLFQQQQFDAALSTLNRALELGGESADLLANRGAVTAALGNMAAALADLKRALELDPQHELARENLDRLEELTQPSVETDGS